MRQGLKEFSSWPTYPQAGAGCRGGLAEVAWQRVWGRRARPGKGTCVLGVQARATLQPGLQASGPSSRASLAMPCRTCAQTPVPPHAHLPGCLRFVLGGSCDNSHTAAAPLRCSCT